MRAWEQARTGEAFQHDVGKDVEGGKQGMSNKGRTEGREGAWYDTVCWPYYKIIV